MAEIIPVPVAAADENEKGERGRRPNFSTDEDKIFVREVYAAKTHVAGHGQVRSCFEETAVRPNANPNLTPKVSWKSVQDRYAKAQAAFDKCDTVLRSKIGMSEDFSELDELLSEMSEARVDVEASKAAAKAPERERKKRKEAAGAFVVGGALKRRRAPEYDGSICKKDGKHDEEGVENKKSNLNN